MMKKYALFPGCIMPTEQYGYELSIRQVLPMLDVELVDLEGFMQEEAGVKMGVSRGTIWRLLQSAREKVARMLTEGRELIIVRET